MPDLLNWHLLQQHWLCCWALGENKQHYHTVFVVLSLQTLGFELRTCWIVDFFFGWHCQWQWPCWANCTGSAAASPALQRSSVLGLPALLSPPLQTMEVTHHWNQWRMGAAYLGAHGIGSPRSVFLKLGDSLGESRQQLYCKSGGYPSTCPPSPLNISYGTLPLIIMAQRI